MHSIRTKITAVATGAIIVTMVIAAALGVAAIRNIGTNSAKQTAKPHSIQSRLCFFCVRRGRRT